MADVRPLRGVRYHSSLAAEIGRLIAPPYDTPLADRPAGPPTVRFNIGHLENVALSPTTDPHALAAARYRAWREDGILTRDPLPALYLHEQAFEDRGERVVRRGVLARVRLTQWNEGVVVPHERTFPGPRQERLARLRAVAANLSPLYLLYRDPARELDSLLRAATAGLPTALAGTDAAGADHRLVVLTQSDQHEAVSRFFADRRLYVADGHHRYEAALAYRDERRAAESVRPSRSPGANRDGPAEFVLVLLADIADPGVRVLPTHRLVHGLAGLDPAQFRVELGRVFDLDRVSDRGSPSSFGADGALCELRFAGENGAWRVRSRPGAPHAALMPVGPGPAWRSLDVAIIGSVVLERLLGLEPERLPAHVAFTHDLTAADAAVATGKAQLAILLRRPSLTALMAVADAGDTLPAKSTYFDPKAPAGLVINELTE